MNANSIKNAIGIISSRQAVTQVLDELIAIDFPMQKISVFATESKQKKLHNTHSGNQIVTPIEGAKAGAITGGTAGGVLAVTTGLGILMIPGFGPALAVESVLTTLLAGGASAIFGSLCGAFQGWFAPEKQVKLWQPSEDFLVKVEGTADEIQQAEYILRYWGVREWHIYELSKRLL
ncbi:hypothetical protein NIES2107_72300 (plasmid) [Nostoc carneum NIES-2107]|nr:hypothetical protein NIES2107_72300 [Nostoc carneum NIES-2107]